MAVTLFLLSGILLKLELPNLLSDIPVTPVPALLTATARLPTQVSVTTVAFHRTAQHLG
jgi:hypothetical protein